MSEFERWFHEEAGWANEYDLAKAAWDEAGKQSQAEVRRLREVVAQADSNFEDLVKLSTTLKAQHGRLVALLRSELAILGHSRLCTFDQRMSSNPASDYCSCHVARRRQAMTDALAAHLLREEEPTHG
jgi:hypothetical protein